MSVSPLVAYYLNACQCFALTFELTALPHIKHASRNLMLRQCMLFLKPYFAQSFHPFNCILRRLLQTYVSYINDFTGCEIMKNL